VELTEFSKASSLAWLKSVLTDEPGDLDPFLELTVGLDPTKEGDEAKVYRPYIVGALTIVATLPDDVIRKAKGGTEFGDQMVTVSGWIAKQRMVDTLKTLTVPKGAEANLGSVLLLLGRGPTGSVPGPYFSDWSNG
jgi:hypothetical protein